MARRCKDCPDGIIEREEKVEKIVHDDNKEKGLKKFTFPRLNKTVLAKDLSEANELVKKMSEVEIETK